MKRDWLIQLRKSKRMTQENVAAAAFIDRGYYAQIESGVRNPSFSVAINIAKVLNFDPALLFQEYLYHSSSQPSIKEISNFFRIMNKGKVLYLYNIFESYLNHAINFLLNGITTNSCAILIDNKENLIQIQQRLKTIWINTQENKFIYLIDVKEYNLQEPHWQSFQTHFDGNSPIRIWLHQKQDPGSEVVSTLQYPIEDIKLNSKKILFINTFNASTVSAGMNIELMRKYSYLMTDFEIVYSPLYNSNEKSFIFPSLFNQEKM